jgi:hypothetical protein
VTEKVPFSEAYQNAIFSRAVHILEQIDGLRHTGFDRYPIAELEAEVRALADRAGVRLTGRPPAWKAAAMMMLVSIDELEPRRLKGYGDLDPEGQQLLETTSARLRKLAYELLAELDSVPVSPS